MCCCRVWLGEQLCESDSLVTVTPVGDCVCSQGVEGASAAAHALSLPAEAYGNDVSGHHPLSLLSM